MFVEDNVPKKYVGVEELEGCIRIFERRIDEGMLERDPTPADWMDEGARLVLALLRDGRFRYPQDLVDVYDARRNELFGWNS